MMIMENGLDLPTGWSNKTVTSNLFLTCPKISKCAITQLFLGSFYRAVSVFWCSNVSSVWIFAFRSFFNIKHLLQHTRPKPSYTPLDASKPHKRTYTPLLCSQKPPQVISGQFSTTTDINRHQATLTDVPRHPKRLLEDVWLFRKTSNGVLWCLFVSDGVC